MIQHLEPWQIRGGLGAADVSLNKFADISGVSERTMQDMANSARERHEETMARVCCAFLSLRIKFEGNTIKKMAAQEPISFGGGAEWVHVMYFIRSAVMQLPAEERRIDFGFVAESLSPEPVIAIDQEIRNAGIKTRSLVKQGDTHILGNLEDYRTVPSPIFDKNGLVINFANYTTDSTRGEGEKGQTIILNHPTLVERNQQLFEELWEQGTVPTKTTAPAEKLYRNFKSR